MNTINFTHFAIKLWQNPKIQQELLFLQNNHSISAITVLYAHWCDYTAISYDITTIHYIQRYENIYTIPTRILRRQLSKNTAQYKTTLNTEIQQEMNLIKQLPIFFPALPCGSKNAIIELSHYYAVPISSTISTIDTL